MREKTRNKLLYLAETKSLIKSALIEKGQEVADGDDFRSYAEKILAISGGGSADKRVKYVTFMWEDVELIEYPVIVNDTVKEPVSAQLIGIPTKEPTQTTEYTFDGWSLTNGGTADENALTNVTEDRTVYVAFKESARMYTAKFYDATTGELLKEEQVPYGSQATPPETFREGYDFMGWIPSDLTITTHTDFNGTWELDQGWLVSMGLPADMPYATSAKYSADGTRLFFASGTYIYMYDTTTNPYTKLKSVNAIRTIFGLDISPNGKWLAVACYPNSSPTTVYSSLRLYGVGTSSLTDYSSLIPASAQSASGGSCWAVAFSADSSKLITEHSKNLYVFDVGSYTTLTFTSTPIEYSGSRLDYLEMSPDMTKIVALANGSSSAAKNVSIFDVENNYANVTSTYYPSNVPDGDVQNSGFGDMLSYSPDGKYVACVFKGNGYYASSSGVELAVLDTTTTPYTAVKQVKDVNGVDNGNVLSVAYSADGSLLALTRDKSPFLEVYDTNTWQLKEAPLTLPTSAYCCAFGANNHLFVGGTTNTLYRVKK